MKLMSHKIGLLIAIFLFTPFLLNAQTKTTKLKKGVNIAINITNKHKQPPQTYTNIGLISNYEFLNGFGFNAISSITLYKTNGFQLTGITNITGLDVNGFQTSGFANITGRDTKGIALSGLLNVNGKSTNGFALSGLANFSGNNMNGVALSGIMNINGKNGTGLQLSGIANIAGSTQKGIMIGGLMNASGDSLKGIQITSLLNISAQANNGAQIAALSNITTRNHGFQLGLANYGSTNKGLQAGVVNVSNKGKHGFQIGLVNINTDEKAHQIGCVNLNPSTQTQLIISSGSLHWLNLAVRFKNKYTYTEIGSSSFHSDINKEIAVSGFYRAGIYHALTPKFELSGDAAFYHTETLKNKHCNYPSRLYTLHPRINLSYKIIKGVEVFISGGYSWSHSYKHNTYYKHKPTFEGGIILF